MRYRLLATYQGAPYEAGVGPAESDVVLFAACPPPEELRFEPATGHWRKQVHLAEVQTLHESRPVGMFRGERCIVLDDLTDRLHIAYLGHDAYCAEQLGYWEVDRGVFELIAPRQEVTDIVEQRLAFPYRDDSSQPIPYPAAEFAAEPQPDARAELTQTARSVLDALTTAGVSGVSVPVIDEPPLPLEAEALRAASAATRREQPTPPAAPDPQAIPSATAPTAMPSAAPTVMPTPFPAPTAAPPSLAVPAVVDSPTEVDPPGQPQSIVLAGPAGDAEPASTAAPALAATVTPAPAPAPVVTEAAPPDPPPTGPAQNAPQAPSGPVRDVAADRPGLLHAPESLPPAPAPAPAPTPALVAAPTSSAALALAPTAPAPTAPAPVPPAPTSAMAVVTPQPEPELPAAEPGLHIAVPPRRRRAARRRLPTQRIFSDLAAQAAIPAAAYAVGEDVDGAMCLMRTDDGFEVFNSSAGSRHEVRIFADEESAYFYLFGVLVAEQVRTGALAPRQ